MSDARQRVPAWTFAAALVIAGVAAYANSLSNPFVFDDSGSIVENGSIRALTRAAWSGPSQSAMAGRPIANVSLAVNYALGGLSPTGYHLWNLAVHLLSGLLLFGIVRRTLERRGTALAAGVPVAAAPRGRRDARRGPRLTAGASAGASTPAWLAFACALLWLLHPLHTEVIDYVTQRTESMMGLAYLLTLYAAMRGWTAVAIASCAAGMLTKESMVTAPLMVLIYDAVFVGGTFARALRERWRLYAGLAATWLALVAAMSTGTRSHSAGFSAGISVWTYLLNQPPIIVEYLRRALWPAGLILDYGMPRPVTIAEILPSAGLVLLMLALTGFAWFRRRELAFLGIWFFVTLAPTSSVVPIATEVGAERRMYLPLAALVTLLVVGAAAGLSRVTSRSSRRVVVGGVFATAACALLALTVHRNQEFASSTRVWRTVVDRRPHGRAHYNLGLHLREEGRRAEALAEYDKALADTPEAHYAIGFELDADGDRRKAIEHYREYIRLKPEDVNVIRAYNLLGRALDAEDRPDEAVAAFRQVILMQPGNADARGALADLALRQHRFDDAVRGYQEYIRLAPQNAVARFNLGLALTGAGRVPEAAGAFAEAVRLNPRDTAFRVNLAEALISLGRTQEAVTHYSAAVQLQPDDQELFARMSEVVQQAGVHKKGGQP